MCNAFTLWRFWVLSFSLPVLVLLLQLFLLCYMLFPCRSFFFTSSSSTFPFARTPPTLSSNDSFYVSDYCIVDYVMCARVARYFSAFACRNKYFFHIVAIATIQLPLPLPHCRVYDDLYKICECVCAWSQYRDAKGKKMKKKREKSTPSSDVHSIRYIYIFFNLFFAYTTAMLCCWLIQPVSRG